SPSPGPLLECPTNPEGGLMQVENREPRTERRRRDRRIGPHRFSVFGFPFSALALAAAVLSAPASAQVFGVGGSVGWVNDGSHNPQFDHFDFGNYAGWLEYRMETDVILRLS